jgi:hypothetical protein
MAIKLERPDKIYYSETGSCPDYDVGDVIMIVPRSPNKERTIRVTIVGTDGNCYLVRDRWNKTYSYPRSFVYGRIPVKD